MPRRLSLGLICVLVLGMGSLASADPKVVREIHIKNKEAMESYDLLEYERAQSILKSAIALARKHDIKNRAVARSYLNLAIVLYSGLQDEENARLALIESVRIDDTIEIGRAYRTNELTRLLQQARREFGEARARDCQKLEGVGHIRLETAPRGSSLAVRGQLGPNLNNQLLHVHFRPGEGKKFARIEMSTDGTCSYIGSIPAEATTGDTVLYYLEVTDDDGRVLARRGSEESPYIVRLEGGGELANDSENPLLEREKAAKENKNDRFMAMFAGGSGGGIVTGSTEQTGTDVDCCLGASLLNVAPEVGYLVRPNLSVGAAFRLGFPLGANLPGHATNAPAGLIRVRYAFADKMEGLQAIGSVGGGIFRNTVRLNMATTGRDVDTSVSGPFMIGPGLGYWFPVGQGMLKLVMELHSLVAFSAGVKEVGNGVQTGFGVQFDINVGVAVTF